MAIVSYINNSEISLGAMDYPKVRSISPAARA